MAKKTSTPASKKAAEPHLHVTQKAAVGTGGALIGAVVGGPIGAMIGGVIGLGLGAAADRKPSGPKPARSALPVRKIVGSVKKTAVSAVKKGAVKTKTAASRAVKKAVPKKTTAPAAPSAKPKPPARPLRVKTQAKAAGKRPR